MNTTRSVRLASYNIHGGVGWDRHFVPNRIVDVLRELDADVIALQEVESRATGFDMLDFLATQTGLTGIAGPTLVRANGDYGNALLTRHPVLSVRRIDLSVPRREPRGAIDAELEVCGAPLRVIATHLGLLPGERQQQVKKLLAALVGDRPMPTVLMGDLNEWFIFGRTLRWLNKHFPRSAAARSFPSPMPVFALDRIWAQPPGLLRSVQAHRSRMSRIASDHLPVTAFIDLPSCQGTPEVAA